MTTHLYRPNPTLIRWIFFTCAPACLISLAIAVPWLIRQSFHPVPGILCLVAFMTGAASIYTALLLRKGYILLDEHAIEHHFVTSRRILLEDIVDVTIVYSEESDIDTSRPWLRLTLKSGETFDLSVITACPTSRLRDLYARLRTIIAARSPD